MNRSCVHLRDKATCLRLLHKLKRVTTSKRRSCRSTTKGCAKRTIAPRVKRERIFVYKRRSPREANSCHTLVLHVYSSREAEVLKEQPKPCSTKDALERAAAWSTEHAPIILRYNGSSHYEPTVVFDAEWKTFCAQHFPDHVLGHAARAICISMYLVFCTMRETK